MSQPNQVPLQGSERSPLAGAKIIGPAAPDEQIEVTVRVRAKQQLPSLEEMCSQPASQRRPG